MAKTETHYYRGYEIAVEHHPPVWQAHLFRTRHELPSPENRFASDVDKETAILAAKLIVDGLLKSST